MATPADTSGSSDRFVATILSERILLVLFLLAACYISGLCMIVLFAFRAGSVSGFLSMAGMGFLLATGIFFSGMLFGFLFGIPRSPNQGSRPREAAADAATGQGRGSDGAGYKPNANLEEISDWLTKILVGVGLTQLSQLPAMMGYYSTAIAPAFGDAPGGAAFAIAILVFFSVDGFLVGYLWTRRYYAQELEKTDTEVKQFHELEKFKSEKERQNAVDMEAMQLCEDLLNPPQNMPFVPQEVADRKVTAASKMTRTMIYYKAEYLRRMNWADKPVMERTEKIFRALIASDTECRYHNNHGQLAYVLMDKRNPDNAAARAEFDKAIEIRGPWQQQDNLWYEFYRAVCRILTDEEFGKGQPSTKAAAEAIITDLRDSLNQPGISDAMAKSEPVMKWVGLNKLDLEAPGAGGTGGDADTAGAAEDSPHE